MTSRSIIGLDFGTESARGVVIDATTGRQEASHTHPYRHGVMTERLPDGTVLPPHYALQNAPDYLEAAEAILRAIGAGREVAGIGIDFTASSPLPAATDGTPLSLRHPDAPHAYVKLWKHAAAQPYADAINARGGDFLESCGGRLSGEWLLAKAAQIAAEAPGLWAETERFIEAGDWLAWQLTGTECRSRDFAAYKAQYQAGRGYPVQVVPGLAARLAPPATVGTPCGALSADWRRRTGILGEAVVAVAVIDSHVVLPAVGAVRPGVWVGALGTSAAYLLLEKTPSPLPPGLEAVAESAVLPDLWCYEAGQAGFGDMLAWFVRTFPRDADLGRNFALYNEEAAALAPGQNGLVTLDWWSGNRVPYGDSGLAGLIAGFTMGSTAAGIYRSLLDGLCFGAHHIMDRLTEGGLGIDRILLTSGLAEANPLLIQTMADVLGREIEVPIIRNPTAVGAAIHGAVAGGVVPDFVEGAARFGAREARHYRPDPPRHAAYRPLYRDYLGLAENAALRKTLRRINGHGD
jgi:L-ribulokinase